MAKWPGTQLYFKSKVTFVRDDDNEYDVQFEDGTVYTLKAKDVKKQVTARAKAPKPSRSRSRGRSPSRKTAAEPKSPAAPKPKPKVAAAPKPDPTPTRQSARIAARADAISDDDETHGKKAIPNPSHTPKKAKGLIGCVCARGSAGRGFLGSCRSVSVCRPASLTWVVPWNVYSNQEGIMA